MAVKLGSTESVAELCWDIYWFLIDRSVSLSSCSVGLKDSVHNNLKNLNNLNDLNNLKPTICIKDDD